MKRNGFIAIAALASAALSGCGGSGGGGDSTPPPEATTTAEGVWSGTITAGGVSNTFLLLVLENDEYWLVYGTGTPSAFHVAGLVQGQGTSNSGSFSSSNAKGFGTNPPWSGTISASYRVGTSISGSATLSLGSVTQTATFSGTPMLSGNYSYDTAAKVSDIAGSWNMTTFYGYRANMSIGTSGAFSANVQQCAIIGTVSPRLSGKNVFNVSLTFGAAPCAGLPGQMGAGVAVSYPLTSTTRQLVMVGVDSTRSTEMALFGVR